MAFYKVNTKFIISALTFFLFQDLGAQCSSCDITINNNDISSYTITTGQTFCIAANFTCTGVINLNGGTLCNKGTINCINLNSGTFNNYGIAKNNSNSVINLNGDLKVLNAPGSRLIYRKNLSVNSINNTDSFSLIISKGAYVNIGSNFEINSGRFRLQVGSSGSAIADFFPTASLNISGNFSLRSDVNISLNAKGYINVFKSLNIQGKGTKSINNYGSVSIVKDINIVGDGENLSGITINNYRAFSVLMSVNVTYSNSPVSIINYAKEGSGFEVGQFLTLTQASHTLTNNGKLLVDKDITINNGTIINNHRIKTRDLKCDYGTYTNNSQTKVLRNLAITTAQGKVINNKAIIIKKNLKNKGEITSEKKSFIRTKHFYNETIDASLNGPTNLLNQNNVIDSLNYAQLHIDSISKNYGSISGHNLIDDYSYSGSSHYKMDDAGDSTEISSMTLFRARCGFIRYGDLYIYPEKEVYCPGESISIYFDNHVAIDNISWSFSGTYGFGELPTPNTFTIYDLQSGGTITICGLYWNGTQWCDFCVDVITFSVGGPSVTATSPLYSAPGNTIALNCTPSAGASPYTFDWQPNVYFVYPSTNTDEDPVVSPNVSLTYTVEVTDANGCPATTTVQVIAKPFAHLDKKLNGEYYKLYNNKLFFKYDGQYANTTLNYYVYDKAHADVVLSGPAPVNISAANIGDNRYTLDATSLSNGFYVLEVINEKKEKLFLRFKK